MFYHHGGTVTLSGTNKGNSTVQSYTGNATPGLNFATVDGNVATFVADDALAAGGTYKVMASGVTATYAFSAPGTIAFDEALFAPTYAVTAPGLALTDATEGTVRTYTAAAAPSYKDPENREIGDQGLIKWLSDNDFSQDDINALGDDAEATDKLYECWLLNCSITAQNPGGTIHTTGIAVTNGVVSITVQLVRQSPLGFISGVLHIYGTDDLADDFSLISEEIVGISEGDSTFATAETDGAVTQSVTATFPMTDVTATFFKSKIEFPIPPDEPEDPGDPDDPEGSEE